MPSSDEALPDAFLAYVAGQIDARPEDMPAYHTRSQTRREHLADIMVAFGYRSFDRRMFRDIARWLLSIAQVTRDPVSLAGILIDELRRRRVLLPSSAVLELILHQARARAEHLIHRVLLESLQPADLDRLDTLLAPAGEGETTLLAWLRQAPLSPSPRNMLAIIDRLTRVRGLVINPSLSARIPDIAFTRLSADAHRMTALEKEVGWFRFMASVAGVEPLADPGAGDARTELLSRYATVRTFMPTLLTTFQFEGGPGVSSLLRAVALVRDLFAAGKRGLPDKVPTGFIRRSWRTFVMPAGAIDRKSYEICILTELRDRLRAGDVWVRGSRQCRRHQSRHHPHGRCLSRCFHPPARLGP